MESYPETIVNQPMQLVTTRVITRIVNADYLYRLECENNELKEKVAALESENESLRKSVTELRNYTRCFPKTYYYGI